ncbi:hypothetical protein H5410_028708 [Solanum commersonii]|uniref:Amine oxidase domain-containing protein n=1 Tax=Solanum commersonii TaxID=4109 RepID=A0A9J5Z5K8_SOLCO|nr:hypothetical protein H5410_028708 [Solanum commersonii]
MEGGNKMAAADFGGSVLTGTLGNPLGLLGRQLSYTLHKARDQCPLYRADGKPIDEYLDKKRKELSQFVSLGEELETLRKDFGVAMDAKEMSLFNWHLANLEYAKAGLLSQLSLAFWDQDDPYDMGGDHCFLSGGNGRLVHALAENVPIIFFKIVHVIRYGRNSVKVTTRGQLFEGDMALCTGSLGVLKSGSTRFILELPQQKRDTIKRVGFGLLNKVAMLFLFVFWDSNVDIFGHGVDDSSCRGDSFYSTTMQ